MEIGLNKDIKITEVKKLFFGDMEIGEPIYLDDNSLRELYAVRVWNGQYYRIVCGLDLMPDGKIWIGVNDSFHNDFDSVKNYFNNVCEDTKGGKDWKIINEDMFENQCDEE